MGAPLGGGGHIFVFGDVSVVQGAAGQGGLLHCGAHLALCRGTAAGLAADCPSLWSQENPTAAPTLSLPSI